MADDPGDCLISAIRDGDLGTVQSLLVQYGMPYRKLRSQRCYFLCQSLLSEQEDIAKVLLECVAEVNESKDDFKTPLHHAIEKGYTELVSMLLEKDALVDAKDDRDDTPLHKAVTNKNLEIIELLLNKVANIETKTKEELTPLHLAVKLLGRTKTSKDNLDYTLAARCKLCISNLKIAMDTTDTTTSYTPGEEVVKLLLDRGADVDARNADGTTVLEVAVVQCNFRIIEPILLARPAVKGKANEHCLRIAVESTGVEYRGIVELLVGYGFTLKRRDAKNHGLLHNAVRKGYTKIVDDLLKLGADVEVTHKIANGGTLLHSAAASGRIRIAELLVEHGADVNAKDEKNKTPILYAVENMDPDVTKLLLTNGANDEGRPRLLHTAAERGCSHIMEMILEKILNIDVNAVDNVASTRLRFVDIDRSLKSAGPSDKMYTAGRHRRSRKSRVSDGGEHRGDAETNYELTALHVAAAGGFARIVELLLERNANVGFLVEKVGTPLHCSVIQRDETIVKMLLLRGAEVDAKRGDGMTPLHLAVREGNAKTFELLIKHGADVHERNNRGENLVHMAIQDGHLKMFEKYLLDVFKAGHPKTNDGLTALHMAVSISTLEDVKILLKNGADASVQDNNGVTPLHLAASSDGGIIVEAFIDNLDNIDTTDIDGYTALHKAVNARNLTAVRLLLFHGSDVNIKDKLGRTPRMLIPRDVDRRSLPCRFSRKISLLAVMMEERIVKMMALGLHVDRSNRHYIGVSSYHKDIYHRCTKETESMKRTKIGESNVSFYEFLTTGKLQLAFYSRYRSIVEVLERGDHTDVFKLYGRMIDLRFRKTKIIIDLMDSSASSLSALSGYSLSDYEYMNIFGYLDRRDLQNLTKAGAIDEKSTKKKRPLIQVSVPKKKCIKKS